MTLVLRFAVARIRETLCLRLGASACVRDCIRGTGVHTDKLFGSRSGRAVLAACRFERTSPGGGVVLVVNVDIYDGHVASRLVGTHAMSALEQLSLPLSRACVCAVRETHLRSCGDALGDGDQRRLPCSHALFAAVRSGLDVCLAVHDPRCPSLHRACFSLSVRDVRKCLRAARRTSSLNVVLETRVSLMRWTPLHYACHAARLHGEGHAARLVVEELCQAGARVDARDLAGRMPGAMVARDVRRVLETWLQTDMDGCRFDGYAVQGDADDGCVQDLVECWEEGVRVAKRIRG